YTVYQLGNPIGNLDVGSTLGSYFGLLFLVAAYTAIGVFTSTLSDNQIVAFILAGFICFVFYIHFEGIDDIFSMSCVEQLGMCTKYNSMCRGVLNARDSLYFLSVSLFFLSRTRNRFITNGLQKKEVLLLSFALIDLLAINAISNN